MQEKERVASEEAEKRLKAALTAKREPNINGSRVASPGAGDTMTSGEPTTDVRAALTETQTTDASMEALPEGQNTGNSPTPEVR